MPIYAYKCSACGFAKDTLQKLSDPPLTVCPECGQDTFSKQVTAAGFQLKGSGWYVTDFRNNGAPSTASAKAAESGNTAAPATSGNPVAGGAPGSGKASDASAAGAATSGAAAATTAPAQPAAAAKPTSGSASSA